MLRFLPLLVLCFVFLVGSGAYAAPQKATPLYLSFEQRLVISYALLAQGANDQRKDEIAYKLMNYRKKGEAQEAREVRVANFEEFLKHFRGEWPNTHSLDLDIQIIERSGPRGPVVYKAPSPRIQKQIDNYMEWQQNELADLVRDQTAAKNIDLNELVTLSQGANPEKALTLKILERMGSVITEQMQELDTAGAKIAKTAFAGQKDAVMRILLESLFSEYYQRLSPSSRKLIVSAFLGGDLKASELQRFEVMVQNSGPQLQKLLQIVARQGDMDPSVSAIFQKLENSVRPVSSFEVAQLMQAEANNYDFTYFEEKPLGVGTMAQVHRAKIRLNGKRFDVVVRFIKPGIEGRVQEDHIILTEVARLIDAKGELKAAGGPILSPVVEDVTGTVTAELNQPATKDRQRLAKPRYERRIPLRTPEYNGEIELHVPVIFESQNGPSQFMVQELVIGKNLGKESKLYEDTIPGLKKGIVDAVAKTWALELLFKGGFYHSDLHQGNFLVHVTDEKVMVQILDYGMGGVITRKMQNQVMMLGAGIDLLDVDIIANAFWSLSEKKKNKLAGEDFRYRVAQRVKQLKAQGGPAKGIEDWTSWALEQKLKLPYDFVSLNRGIVIINKMLAGGGSSLTVTKLMKSLSRSEALNVYRRLVIEEGLSHANLLKLGWIELTTSEVEALKTPKTTVSGAPRCEAVFQ